MAHFGEHGREIENQVDGGSTVQLQVNGVDAESQVLLNLVDSPSIQVFDNGTGNIEFDTVDIISGVANLQETTSDSNTSLIGVYEDIVFMDIFVPTTNHSNNIILPAAELFTVTGDGVKINSRIYNFIGDVGTHTKSISVIDSGTINGATDPLVFVTGETYSLQSNGIEWRIINHTGGAGGGSTERFGIEDNTGAEDRTFNSTGSFNEAYTGTDDDGAVNTGINKRPIEIEIFAEDTISTGDFFVTKREVALSIQKASNEATAEIKCSLIGSGLHVFINSDDWIRFTKGGFTHPYDKTSSDLTNKDILCIDNTDVADGEFGKLYRYTGDLSGGSTPNLQVVTDVANTTTNDILIKDGDANTLLNIGHNGEFIGIEVHTTSAGGISVIDDSGDVATNIRTNSVDTPQLITKSFEVGNGSSASTFLPDNITVSRTNQLPDASGTLALSVNGTAADTTGNITIDLGIRPYKIYSFVLNESDSHVFVSTELQNELSVEGTPASITWAKTTTGTYTATSDTAGTFQVTGGLIIPPVQVILPIGLATGTIYYIQCTVVDDVTLVVYTGIQGTLMDNILNLGLYGGGGSFFEIRYYPPA